MVIKFYRGDTEIGVYQESKKNSYTEALIHAYVSQSTDFIVSLSYKRYDEYFMHCDFESDTKFTGHAPTQEELLNICRFSSMRNSASWANIKATMLGVSNVITQFLEWAKEHDLFVRAEN